MRTLMNRIPATGHKGRTTAADMRWGRTPTIQQHATHSANERSSGWVQAGDSPVQGDCSRSHRTWSCREQSPGVSPGGGSNHRHKQRSLREVHQHLAVPTHRNRVTSVRGTSRYSSSEFPKARLNAGGRTRRRHRATSDTNDRKQTKRNERNPRTKCEAHSITVVRYTTHESHGYTRVANASSHCTHMNAHYKNNNKRNQVRAHLSHDSRKEPNGKWCRGEILEHFEAVWTSRTANTRQPVNDEGNAATLRE